MRFTSSSSFLWRIRLLLLPLCLAALVDCECDRYLLYDVNPGEGVNLRRDVHVRLANTVRALRANGGDDDDWCLVLPPWGRVYHWKRQIIRQPWRSFFNVTLLSDYVPSIDFDDFLREHANDGLIESVVYLQHYEGGWGGHWEEKWDRKPCIEQSAYRRNVKDDVWDGWFFGYGSNYASPNDGSPVVRATSHVCYSIQGDTNTLIRLLKTDYNQSRTVLVDRAETPMHAHFADASFWSARASMRPSDELIAIATKFREEKLKSTDKSDGTTHWARRPTPRSTRGGPFVCAHWRRRDFVTAYAKEIPSIRGAAQQIVALAQTYSVTSIFVASDAADDEFAQLKDAIRKISAEMSVYRFTSHTLSDLAVSIIDQWICAHARAFVGSHVSTFSFRIQEDRELLGFPPSTTFRRLCPDGTPKCEQPAQWKVRWENDRDEL